MAGKTLKWLAQWRISAIKWLARLIARIIVWFQPRLWHLGALGIACLMMWDVSRDMWPLTVGLLVLVACVSYGWGYDDAEHRYKSN
jgi:hypothetical protein